MTVADRHYFYDLSGNGARPAVVDAAGQQLTYTELAAYVDRFQCCLPEARQLVFIRAANSLSTLVAYLACLRAGHVALLLEENLNDALLSQLVAAYRPNYLVDGRKSLDDTLTAQSDSKHILHPDLGLLLSTSGSTGSPKLVRLSRGNLQSNAESIVAYLPMMETDTAITALPFCYSYGLSIINTHLLKGARLALTGAAAHSREFWLLFKEAQVNSFSGVPLSFSLLQQMRFERADYPDLRYLTCAGGKLNREQWQYLVTISKNKQLPVYAMYGQTEATARMGYIPPEILEQSFGGIGRAIPGGEFYLKDTEGKILRDDDEIGELVYRGTNVMMGYAQSLQDLSLPAMNAELATGDLALRRGEAYFIRGRLKRFIKIAGHRINLDQLEQQFSTRGLAFCAMGEDDALLVAVLTGTLAADSATLVSGIAEHLQVNPRYITVKQFEGLPQLASGKPDYSAMREAFDHVA